MEHRVSELTISRPGWRRPPHLSLEAGACEILTVGLRVAPLCADEQEEQLAAAPEPCPPVYCRYWDHNTGAAPIGNQPLTLWMSGNVLVGQTTRFSLGLSNDSLDREVVGKAEITAPPEWTVIPRQVPYRIAPGSQAVYEIMVVVPPDASPRFLRTITEDAGRTIQDVLPVGKVAPLSASLSREEKAFCVDLYNPNADYVEGQVTLVTPMESWGSAVGSFALCEVSPRVHCFRLEAGGQARFRFSVRDDFKGLWAVAKVMYYGQVQYLQERPGS